VGGATNADQTTVVMQEDTDAGTGTERVAFRIAERVQAVDAEAVCRVAAEVFRPGNRNVVAAVSPEDEACPPG
jgi:predicted Zn-dependent peptidase